MCALLEKIGNGLEAAFKVICSVYSFFFESGIRTLPPFWRKAFILLLPITGPLYGACCVILGLIAIAFMLLVSCTMFPLIWVLAMWKGKTFEEEMNS